MSKKRFSAGLDDLFNDSHHHDTARWADAAVSDAGASFGAAAGERRAVGKNFMADLDALLQEALGEDAERSESGMPNEATPTGKTKSAAGTYRPALSGLDALIRQTVDIQEVVAAEQPGTRRLTVAVDKTKLDKLKAIARLENSYLKDLISGVIDEYITEYRQRKGIDL